MIRVNDKWLRIFLFLLPSSLFLYDILISANPNKNANIIYILTVLAVCEISRMLVYRSRSWFKSPHKKLKRLSTLLPVGFVTIGIIFVISKALRNYLAFGQHGMQVKDGFAIHINEKQVELGLVGASFLYGVLVFMVLFLIYEQVYHFARLKHMEKEGEKLEKARLQAELQQLKGIVNPHFLFNNLNSLSSLISEDPQRADDFLNELTRVFRYMLRNNEMELTSLAQELEFIHSYFHLLQTRYGNGIQMQLRIDEACHNALLPPLTMQLLVENAVKHNRVNKDEPLVIEIFSNEEKKLVVRNNLLVRKNQMESTGIGLKSINSRYYLLKHEALTIEQDQHYFSVIVPLIPPVEKFEDALPAKTRKSLLSYGTS